MANHITQWKPQVWVDRKHLIFNTYAEVKSNLSKILEECNDDTVMVLRSRRGEWGEWFEFWALDHRRKPVIVREGWS